MIRGSFMRWTIIALFVLFGITAQVATRSDQAVSYSRQIAPLLTIKCGNCHGNRRYLSFDKIEGNLDVTTYQAILRGGGRGQTVLPGDPARSVILSDLSKFRQDHPTLSDVDKLLIRGWIMQGAKLDSDTEDRFSFTCENVDVETAYKYRKSVYVRSLDEAHIRVEFTEPATNRPLETLSYSVNWEYSLRFDAPGRFQVFTPHNTDKWPRQVNAVVTIRYAKNPFGTFVFCGEFSQPNEGTGAFMMGIDPFIISSEDDATTLTYWLDNEADVTIAISPYDSRQPVYVKSQKGMSPGLHREQWNLTDLKNVSVRDGNYLLKLTIISTKGEYTARDMAVGLLRVQRH